MGKQASYGEDLNSFWADDALACASMLSSDWRRDVGLDYRGFDGTYTDSVGLS